MCLKLLDVWLNVWLFLAFFFCFVLKYRRFSLLLIFPNAKFIVDNEGGGIRCFHGLRICALPLIVKHNRNDVLASLDLSDNGGAVVRAVRARDLAAAARHAGLTPTQVQRRGLLCFDRCIS